LRRLTQLVPVLLLLVAIGACNAATPYSAAPSATSLTSTPSADKSDAAALPMELIGEWESQKGTDPVVLTLRESGSYHVRRGVAQGFGAVSASAGGAQLDFFGGDPCQERGSYEWSVQGDTLTFTPIGEDGCPGRTAVLDNLTYSRRE
jgi:hypothetical protein